MGASKKWNTDTEQWEKRYPNENPLSFVGNQFKYWNAKRKQDDVMNRRPDLQTLSNRGCMPGVDVGIFVAKCGIVRSGKNGPVCGTWHAEPITGAAVSYRGNYRKIYIFSYIVDKKRLFKNHAAYGISCIILFFISQRCAMRNFGLRRTRRKHYSLVVQTFIGFCFG